MTSMAGLNVVVTGGTGSFGKAFIEHLLTGDRPPRQIIVVSRDEFKQHEMALQLPESSTPVRYRLGDVRDAAHLTELTKGADVIVHAAAMKQVPAAERNPMEAVRTNVLGAQNVIAAAKSNGVPRVIALSTDKAVMPSTFYGASKLMLERLFLNADLTGESRFTVVRYANVFGARGSVIPLFLALGKTGEIPVTDPEATRFSITLAESVALVMFAHAHGWGGELICPVCPSYRLRDVAEAVAPTARQRIIGSRPGEKRHESMFSMTEAPFVLRRGRYYVVTPSGGRWTLADYCAVHGDAQPLPELFEYESVSNSEWLDLPAIRDLVRREFPGQIEEKSAPIENHVAAAVS